MLKQTVIFEEGIALILTTKLMIVEERLIVLNQTLIIEERVVVDDVFGGVDSAESDCC